MKFDAANPFWLSLKKRVFRSDAQRRASLLTTSVLLPIAEAILVNLWTSNKQGAFLVAIAVLAFVHVALTAILLSSEAIGPDVQLARAVEVADELDSAKRELVRRQLAHRLVRRAFELLTGQTCAIPDAGGPESWCKAGFMAGCQPIIDSIAENMQMTFGIVSPQWTLEVHLADASMVGPAEEAARSFAGHVLQYLHPSGVTEAAVLGLPENRQPAALGKTVDVAATHHIRDLPEVYLNGNVPYPNVYFRRFATCPITEACSDNRIGVLVITSMQEDSFAEDILDTLQFVSAIISNYVYGYVRCYFDQQRLLRVAEALQGVGANEATSTAVLASFLSVADAAVAAGPEADDG